MPEIIDFDVSHHYNLFEIGIVVEAVLTRFDISAGVRARIDTGATFCIFRRDIGEELGLVIEDGILRDIGTATGSFRVFGHEIEMTVLGIVTVSTVYFAESSHFNRNVLGRTGFLDRVKFGLIEPEGKLLLSEYKR